VTDTTSPPTRKLVGTIYKVPVVAPAPERTHLVPIGPVTIGVEYRAITDPGKATKKVYAEDPDTRAATARYVAARRAKEAAGDTEPDGGVSLHVLDTDSGVEYLRFDTFDVEPHYHYITPASEGQPFEHRVVLIDEDALGPAFDWALATIRTRLGTMLDRSGASHLTDHLDQDRIDAAVEEIARLAAVDLAAAGHVRRAPA
jgi:hypothetical protein